MSHIQLSKELNTFSYQLSMMDSSQFQISKETHARVIVSRLYYSLFNRILEELPKIAKSNSGGKHETIFQILKKQASQGAFYDELWQTFKSLKDFREWADYRIVNNIPLNGNFTATFQKTYKFINAKKVIA